MKIEKSALEKQRRENRSKMSDMLDVLDKENRAFTDEEKAAYTALEADNYRIEAALRYADGEGRKYEIESDLHAICESFREAKNTRSVTEINFGRLMRAMSTTNVAPTIAEKTAGLVNPLEQGLILGLLGIPMPTNCGWNEKYTNVSAVTATLEDENADLGVTDIPMSALTPAPKRVGIKIEISNAALEASDYDLMNNVVKPQALAAIQRLLNAWMFDTSAYKTGCEGAFVSPGTTLTFAAAVPTYKELLKLQAGVRKSGAINDGTYAYIMSSPMAAELRATAKDTGSGIMIIDDNNRIGGVPVYETEYLEAANTTYATKGPKFVGFGRFSDFPIRQIGTVRLGVDSTSAAVAGKDTSVATLNTYFAMKALRPKSFALGTATIA